MFRDRSVKGSLSFSVVLNNERKPVSDMNIKSSPTATTESLDTQPTPRITSSNTIVEGLVGPL